MQLEIECEWLVKAAYFTLWRWVGVGVWQLCLPRIVFKYDISFNDLLLRRDFSGTILRPSTFPMYMLYKTNLNQFYHSKVFVKVLKDDWGTREVRSTKYLNTLSLCKNFILFHNNDLLYFYSSEGVILVKPWWLYTGSDAILILENTAGYRDVKVREVWRGKKKTKCDLSIAVRISNIVSK